VRWVLQRVAVQETSIGTASQQIDAHGKADRAWAPVRVFPVPDYSGQNAVAPTRTDFRETIFWSPEVITDVTGKAEVSFYLSDAVTSFRVTTEGATAGAAGRHETVISSSLPFQHGY
jgi:uncharacterized protein YfaS (alpha-2-macroglobulin family)